jgi:hypothetical protein
MKFTIPDRSPGASFSRLRFATELPITKAKALPGRTSPSLAESQPFRLRWSHCRGARLACEADFEHKAKATANNLSSILVKRSDGVLEYRRTGISRRDQLPPLRRVENGSSRVLGKCPCRFPRLTLGLVRELVRPL